MAAVFSACDREEEPIPAYLTVEPFQLLATSPDVHGSVSEKITHARMFLFDNVANVTHQLGTVELPATIPVLNTGEFELNIDPVIKANGNTFYLQTYPFYKRFTTTVNLQPNEDTTVEPTSTYSTEAVFEFIEDFETPSVLFSVDRDDNTATSLQKSEDDVFEGDFSGKVTLDTANAVIVAQTANLYEIDYSTAAKIFMELNYKTDVPLEFGVVAIDDQGEEVVNFEFVVLEKAEWNKIYFDMTDLISTAKVNRFAFIFRGGIPFQDGKFTLDKAEIYLDNIKLVHF